MAMTTYERVAARTAEMDTAIYAALDAIDGYQQEMSTLITEHREAAEPNQALIKRLGQFQGKAQTMTSVIEDDVLTELLFCVDRLFSVELAERGEFI